MQSVVEIGDLYARIMNRIDSLSNVRVTMNGDSIQDSGFVMYTGTAGMHEFNRAMREEAVSWDPTKLYWAADPNGWTVGFDPYDAEPEPEEQPEHVKNPFFFIAKNRPKK